MTRALAALLCASLVCASAAPAWAAERQAGPAAPGVRVESLGAPSPSLTAPSGAVLEDVPALAPSAAPDAAQAAASAPAQAASAIAATPAADPPSSAVAPLAEAAKESAQDPEEAWRRLLEESRAGGSAVETAPSGGPFERGPRLARAAAAARRVWSDHVRAPIRVFFFGDPEIRQYVKPYDWRIWAGSGLHIAAGAATIAQIKLFGMWIDAMVHLDGRRFLWTLGAALTIHVAAIFVGSFRDLWLNWTKLSLGHDVRAALFRKLLARDPQFFRAHPPSELSTRLLNDAGQVMLRNVDGRVTIPYDLSMAAMSTFMMFHTSLTFGTIVTIPMLAVAWLFLRYGKIQERNEIIATQMRAEAAKEGERRLASFREALRVGDVALARLVAGYDKVSDDLRSIWYRIGKTATINDYGLGFLSYSPVHHLVYFLGAASLFGWTTWLGQLTLGQIQAFAGFAGEFRNGVQGLLYVIIKDFRVARGQTKVVLDWMAQPDPEAPVVEPDALKRASRALGVEVAAGARVGVVEGKAGALKAVAAGLAGPGAGWIDARTSWLPGSVALNLRDGGPMASDEQVAAALTLAGAEFLLAPVRLADGSVHRSALELEAAQAVEHFGEGPMRRALLARLLLQDPELVVVSNPEGHLAGPDLEAFGQALSRALKGRAVIWLWPRADMYGALDRVVTR